MSLLEGLDGIIRQEQERARDMAWPPANCPTAFVDVFIEGAATNMIDLIAGLGCVRAALAGESLEGADQMHAEHSLGRIITYKGNTLHALRAGSSDEGDVLQADIDALRQDIALCQEILGMISSADAEYAGWCQLQGSEPLSRELLESILPRT